MTMKEYIEKYMEILEQRKATMDDIYKMHMNTIAYDAGERGSGVGIAQHAMTASEYHTKWLVYDEVIKELGDFMRAIDEGIVEMAKDKIVEILEENGATDINGYSLINNYGYTFMLDGKKCDARYWANCYGCALDRWDVTSITQGDDGKYIPLGKEVKDKLEHEMNAVE